MVRPWLLLAALIGFDPGHCSPAAAAASRSTNSERQRPRPPARPRAPPAPWAQAPPQTVISSRLQLRPSDPPCWIREAVWAPAATAKDSVWGQPCASQGWPRPFPPRALFGVVETSAVLSSAEGGIAPPCYTGAFTSLPSAEEILLCLRA